MLGVSLSSLLQMSPVLAARLGANYTEIGLLMGAARLAPYVAISPLAGLMLSRILGGRAVLLSSVSTLAALTLSALATDLTWLTAAQVAVGVSMVFYFPVFEILLASEFKGVERMKAYSMFGAFSSIGFLIGSVASGGLAHYLGLPAMFSLVAVLVALTIPAMIRFKTGKLNTGVEKLDFREFFQQLMPALFVTLPFYTVFGIVQNILPGYAALTGVSELEIGLMFLGMWTTRILTSLSMGRRSTEASRRYFLASGLALSVFLALSAYLPGRATMAALLLVTGSVISVVYILTLYMTSTGSSHIQPTAIGVYEMIIGIAFLVGPPIAGAGADAFGVPSLFLGLAALSLVSGMAGTLMRR